VDVRLLYVESCPNLALARQRLSEALVRRGLDPGTVQVELVASPADAERLSFRGSPAILLDGRDPFAPEDAPAGFSCRIYLTDAGPEGAPSVRQLEEALRR
jgi:hypothetical protein